MEDYKRFQPLTSVNLDKIINAGYLCDYDEYEFSATLESSVPDDEAERSGIVLSFDISLFKDKVIVKPIINFNCVLDYCGKRIVLKIGENRYEIISQDVYNGRGGSKMWIALNKEDVVVLKYLASYPGKSGYKWNRPVEIDARLKKKIINFVTVCEESGVLEQEELVNMQQSIVPFIIFNKL